MVGKKVTIRELMQLIEKDRIFYTNSGGGVTIGRGGPLSQPMFVGELLRTCRESNIHTAVETCGYGKWETVKAVFEEADQIFFDLKAMNPELHRKLTGARNHKILENAARVSQLGKEIIFRIPLVSGCNDSADNLKETGEFVASLQKKSSGISVELLPYHNLGEDKYRWLSRTYSLAKLEKPGKEHLEACRQLLAERCGNVLAI
ncbi:MAG: glycyl-radical enzyme activating protein [Firmicutes bacterium]|nr:glycyl-radical enzyme activating protein [Bacillota bacterium]